MRTLHGAHMTAEVRFIYERLDRLATTCESLWMDIQIIKSWPKEWKQAKGE